MTAAPALPAITADELAVHFGVTERSVRKWIARGLPAEKVGHPPRWMIDLDTAGPWVAANARGGIGPPIVGLAQTLEATAGNGSPTAGGEVETPAVDGDDELGGTATHIDRLDRLLEAFTDLLFNAQEFDPRLVTSVKAISTELRRLELHRLEMRQADASLMDRADHVRILGTFARLVVDEIQAWARSTPDAVVDALTFAGVKVTAKRVVKTLDTVLEGQAAELRTRIVEGIEQAEDLE